MKVAKKNEFGVAANGNKHYDIGIYLVCSRWHTCASGLKRLCNLEARCPAVVESGVLSSEALADVEVEHADVCDGKRRIIRAAERHSHIDRISGVLIESVFYATSATCLKIGPARECSSENRPGEERIDGRRRRGRASVGIRIYAIRGKVRQ